MNIRELPDTQALPSSLSLCRIKERVPKGTRIKEMLIKEAPGIQPVTRGLGVGVQALKCEKKKG